MKTDFKVCFFALCQFKHQIFGVLDTAHLKTVTLDLENLMVFFPLISCKHITALILIFYFKNMYLFRLFLILISFGFIAHRNSTGESYFILIYFL